MDVKTVFAILAAIAAIIAIGNFMPILKRQIR